MAGLHFHFISSARAVKIFLFRVEPAKGGNRLVPGSLAQNSLPMAFWV
jgi:hypothetical protein